MGDKWLDWLVEKKQRDTHYKDDLSRHYYKTFKGVCLIEKFNIELQEEKTMLVGTRN
jgi:hypothetical protein